MKARGFIFTLALALGLGLAKAQAEALLFTGSDQGVDITLETTLTGNTLAAVLSLDTSNYSGPGSFLHAISLKLTSQIDLVNITPEDLPGTDANWTTAKGQIKNDTTGPGGNALGSGSGWFSSFWNVNPYGLDVPNGTYEFNYSLDITGRNLVAEPSFKAIYVYGSSRYGEKANGITSTTLAPVPEPGTLLLIGTGLVGIGVGARRRRKQP